MHAVAGGQRVVAGRYLLQDRIGRGAMGTVWRARDPVLARDVAVKEVQVPGVLTEREREVLHQRTLREARAAARLNHPGVVTVFDVVEAEGSPWIVMELVKARSLEQILAGGPLAPDRAAEVGVMLLGALACAHAAGIVHRDVKPSNVLLTADGRTVLTDFGIATLEGDPGLTQVGIVMGTPGFYAPERVRGEPASPASDLWSLGATLFAAVEGHGPFSGKGTPLAVLAAVANDEVPPTHSAGTLGPVIAALLRRDPAQRPDAATAQLMLAAAARPVGAQARSAGAQARSAGAQARSAGAQARASLSPARPALSPTWPALSPARSAPGPARAAAAPDRGRRPRPPWQLLAAGAALVTGAGLLIGLLVTLGGHRSGAAAGPGHRAGTGTVPKAGTAGSLPAGDRWLAVPAAALPAAALPAAGTARTTGFLMAVPASWQVLTRGHAATVRSPAGNIMLTASPVPSIRSALVASLLQRRTLAAQPLPGYQSGPLRYLTVAGAPAASWTAHWRAPGAGLVRAQEVTFSVSTAAGRQVYRLRLSGPGRSWAAGQAVLETALRSLRLPGQ